MEQEDPIPIDSRKDHDAPTPNASLVEHEAPIPIDSRMEQGAPTPSASSVE
jgi:hypothetical protein